MEPQNPGTNTNPNPMAPPPPDLTAPTATPEAAPTPAAQPAPQPATPGVMPSMTTPEPAMPQPQPAAPDPTPGQAPAMEPAPSPAPAVMPAAAPTVTPGANSGFPAQPPMPEGAGPQPQQPVVAGGMGAYPMTSASAQAARRSKKFKLIGIGIIAATVLALGVGAYFVYGALSGIKLKEYKGDGYSLLVPADYEEKEEGIATVFEEDDKEESASQVRVASEAFPRTVTDEEIDTVVEAFKQGVEQGIDEFSGDNEVTNVQITDTTHKGHKAVKVTADAQKDGDDVGRVVMIFAFTKNGYYGLAIVAHHQDTGLDKKIDAIIESFEIEE